MKPGITPSDTHYNKKSNNNLKYKQTLKIITQLSPSRKSNNSNPQQKISDTYNKPIPCNL